MGLSLCILKTPPLALLCPECITPHPAPCTHPHSDSSALPNGASASPSPALPSQRSQVTFPVAAWRLFLCPTLLGLWSRGTADHTLLALFHTTGDSQALACVSCCPFAWLLLGGLRSWFPKDLCSVLVSLYPCLVGKSYILPCTKRPLCPSSGPQHFFAGFLSPNHHLCPFVSQIQPPLCCLSHHPKTKSNPLFRILKTSRGSWVNAD